MNEKKIGLDLSDKSEDYRAGVLAAVLERLDILEAKIDSLLSESVEEEPNG